LISCSTIELLSEKLINTKVLLEGEKGIFYDGLVNIRDSIGKKADFNLELAVKNIIFDIAMHPSTYEVIQYILDNSKKYPFLINSVRNDRTLWDYCSDDAMQKFLFEHGMVPKPKEDYALKENSTVVIEYSNLIMNELIQSNTRPLKEDRRKKDLLKKYARDYCYKLEQLSKDANPTTVKLLNITEEEKFRVMKETLKQNTPPNDQSFIALVIDTVINALESEDFFETVEGGDSNITKPESIGLIEYMIKSFDIPRSDRQELCATLLETHQDLVKNKLSEIKELLKNQDITLADLSTKSQLHTILSELSGNKLDLLFQTISGLDIKEIWQQQQEFKLCKELYIMATQYDPDEAQLCIHGSSEDIINTAAEIIDPSLKTKCDEYIKPKKDPKSAQTPATALAGDETTTADTEKKKILQIIANPEDMTQQQQEFFAGINKDLFQFVKVIPTYDEYHDIISQLPLSYYEQNPVWDLV
jgi:hypothetical protein